MNNSSLNGDIEYSSHIQGQGWQSYIRNGGNSGATTGNSLRMEAIRIRLTGQLSQYYDVYYRVHSANFGWLGWTKNGGEAGSTDFSYAMEAIQIQLMGKNMDGPVINTAYYDKNTLDLPNVNYQTHSQSIGWQSYQTNGATAGTVGQGLRIEAIRISISGNKIPGSIEYNSHIQSVGWQGYVKSSEKSGTTNQKLRTEVISYSLNRRTK